MAKLSGWFRLLGLLAVSFLVSACGGGSSDKTFTVEGQVLNGVLVGSTVEVLGNNGGNVLGTAVTDVDGRFSARVSQQGPYLVRASGGKLNGVDY